MTTWTVTGGAGYIGAHVVRALRASGRDVVVLDDLSTGLEGFVAEGVPLIRGSLNDPVAVAAALDAGGGRPVEGVIHVAGFKYAGESVSRPLDTYRSNVSGTVELLDGMSARGVESLVFSGSAAVFGTPSEEVVTEDTAHAPESPYGFSKDMAERIIVDTCAASPLSAVTLRYFNVVGSSYPDIWDVSPYNLFPAVMKALTEGRTPKVSGTDYATPDGSCVRDYVHVGDIALAHVAAAEALEAGRAMLPAYNLGSGTGTSVLEIMAAMVHATGQNFEPVRAARRPGDPARIVARGDLAARDLDWAMRHSIEEMVRSAWESRPR